MIDTNLTAVFRLTRAAIPHLAHRGGHVVMISSLAGQNPIAGMATYCASKAALDHFATCLMLEVRPRGHPGDDDRPRLGRHRPSAGPALGRHGLDAERPRTSPGR